MLTLSSLMGHSRTKARLRELEAKFDAIGKSQAIIEFGVDGRILTANANFLKTMGYNLGEIVGQHHSMFVRPGDRDSPAYAELWVKLRRGEFTIAEYKRITKGGDEVWLQASYNPILGDDGEPYKIVKYATDVTAQKLVL